MTAPRDFLVTGGCGFIGSNLVRMLLDAYPGERVVNVDVVTYAGTGWSADRLPPALRARYRHERIDVCDMARPAALADATPPGGFRCVFHLAAESHVDRSTVEAVDFVRTNVLGTQAVLDFVRDGRAKRLVHVSTDEVYGSLGARGRFRETSPLHPNSPYAASKAASDLLVLAAVRTHGLDAVVTRCSNNYGPWQFPEKFIPLMITNAVEDRPLPVYGDGRQVRDWIHVDDHGRGLVAAFERGRPGEVYNFGGRAERRNIDVARALLRDLGKPRTLLRFVEDRPGHDRRYAVDGARAARALRWKPRVPFEEGLRATVEWYLGNRAWWEGIKSSGGFLAYYERMYGRRIREGRAAAGGRA